MCETLALEYAAGESDGTRAIPFSTLSDVLFQEWTRRDPSAAIAALNRQSNLPGIEGLRMTMTDRIIRQDPERGLRLMKEWNISSFIPTMKAVGAWAEREPRRAVEAAIGAGSDYAQREALSEVGKAWAKSDPAAALAHAESLTGASRAGPGGERHQAVGGKRPRGRGRQRRIASRFVFARRGGRRAGRGLGAL